MIHTDRSAFDNSLDRAETCHLKKRAVAIATAELSFDKA